MTPPENAAHLHPQVWEYVGDLRDHLGRDHKVAVEAMAGLDRWALFDLHTEKHDD